MRTGITVALALFVCAGWSVLFQFTGLWWAGLWGIPFVLTAPKVIEQGIINIGKYGAESPQATELTREDMPMVYSFFVMLIGCVLTLYMGMAYRNMSPQVLRLKRVNTVSVIRAPKNVQIAAWLKKYAESETGFDYTLKTSLRKLVQNDAGEVKQHLKNTLLKITSGSEVIEIDALRWLYSRLPEETIRARYRSNFLARFAFLVGGYRLYADYDFEDKHEQSQFSLLATLVCDPELSGGDFRDIVMLYWPKPDASLRAQPAPEPYLYDFTLAARFAINVGSNKESKPGFSQCPVENLSDAAKAEYSRLLKADRSFYPQKQHRDINDFRAAVAEYLRTEGL